MLINRVVWKALDSVFPLSGRNHPLPFPRVLGELKYFYIRRDEVDLGLD